MFKFKWIIALIITLGIIYLYTYQTNNKSISTPQQKVTEDVSALQNKIKDLQKTIDKCNLKEQDEKLRKIRLQQLQNPEVIKNKLNETNKLLVYEGVIEYKDYIKEGNWFANKSLSVNLTYNFGIAINLNKINIKFIEETPVLTIPKNELKLEYVELDNKLSKVNGDRSFFSNQFVPEDIKGVLDNSKVYVTDSINNDKSIFDSATKELKIILQI